jgi:hypothetical protein
MIALNVAFFIACFFLTSYLDGLLQAYLDPGTGSMVLQLVLGGVVGLLAIAKLYWRRFHDVVLGRRADQEGTS